MARLATVASAHLCGRVRCGSAPPADVTCVTESFRFLPAQGADTLRDRATERWFAVAPWFFPAQPPEGMDCWHTEVVPVFPFCPVHLSPRDGDHSRFISNVFRICPISRQAVFC